MKQRKLIHNTEWDVLIVLDALRHDYFERVYQRFFDGKLIEATSSGSCTETWIQCWSEQYDLTYVSGNPYMNSAGVPLRGYPSKGKIKKGYIGADHFKRIIDVWNFGWNGKFNTVTPDVMNKAVIDMTDKTNLVIHYVQPHYPYIGETRIDSASGVRLRLNVKKGFYSKKRLQKWSPVRKNKSDQYITQLRTAYMDNLLLVLEHVAELLPHLKGKVVITADHGEFLGEDRLYGHPCFCDHPLLLQIPWFIVGGKR